MATPRHKLIDDQQALYYHLVSSCVRHSFLCGRDRRTGKDYSHRKAWIEERLYHLVPSFALEVHAYAIMSNHLHLVVYFDPQAAQHWSDREVAERWMRAFPVRTHEGHIDPIATEQRRESIAADPQLAQQYRAHLGSVSMFKKYLKQPIALRANREDGCKGHFFEQRFYSGAILDEDGLIAAMAYVDLNPIRAKIVQSIEHCEHTSVHRRLRGIKHSARRLKRALRPLVSGLSQAPRSRMTLSAYLDLLDSLVSPHPAPLPAESPWPARIASIGKYQRAYGAQSVLATWLQARGFRALESALP